MTLTVSDLCSAAQFHASETPDKPFFKFVRNGEASVFTFRDLWIRSGHFCAALQARNIVAGKVVIISMPIGPDLLSAFVGAMRMGAVPTIMPYPNPKQKNALFWEGHTKLYAGINPAAFILTDIIADLYADNLPDYEDAIIRISSVNQEEGISFGIDPATVAFLQHSSGTTSLKKGVKLVHKDVVDHVRLYAEQCGINSDSRIFSWLPLYHDMGLISCFLMPLVIGCTVNAIDNFEWVARPATMLQMISEERLEYAWMPNFGFAHLVRACPEASRYDLSSVKAFINCSEPCRPDTHDAFIAHFATAGLDPAVLQVCYAMAENVFAVTQTDFSAPVTALKVTVEGFDRGVAEPAKIEADHAERAVLRIASCGRPMPGMDVFTVDEGRSPVGEGRIGEIAIRSSSLFAGYNGRDDLTARALDNGIYYSGDLGFFCNGELYITGRKDDLILAYGRNLLAHELEAIVNAVSGVKPGRVVAFDVFSPQSNSNEVAIMAEKLPETDEIQLTRNIRSALDAGAAIVPRHIMLLEDGDLLKTTSGKISRGANRTAFLSTQSAKI